MKLKTKLKKGFTLVELLVAMSLFSLFIFLMTDIFSSTLRLRVESESTSYLDQDAQFIIARLMYDIPRASTVSIPTSLGSTATSLQLSINAINYSYSISNGNLVLNTDVGTDQLNSSSTTVTSITFQRFGKGSGKDTVQIKFTLQSKFLQSSGYETKSYQTTVGMR